MNIVGRIKFEKYKGVSTRIRSDLVVITQTQIDHIIARRGKAFYETYAPLFGQIIADPDYIFMDKQHPNTALACKRVDIAGNSVNLVIRLALEEDDPLYENAIITAIIESNKRFNQRIRNNEPLYKKE